MHDPVGIQSRAGDLYFGRLDGDADENDRLEANKVGENVFWHSDDAVNAVLRGDTLAYAGYESIFVVSLARLLESFASALKNSRA